jgi:molybdopterin molybdotransferase
VDAPAGKRQFRRGFLDREAGTVSPVGPPGSHFLRWLAGADCLIDIAEDVTHLDAGAEVEVWVVD